MKTIFKGLGIIVLIAIIAMLGSCFFQMCHNSKIDTGPKPPAVEKAQYKITFKATGRVLYASEVINLTPALAEGYRRYSLPKGYWETEKNKYIFKKLPLVLDEKIFGIIMVEVR